MHIKALTAVISTAVLGVAFVHTAHAMALSPTTGSSTNGNTGNAVTVAQGDTLSSIASENGTTYIRLYDANTQITDPDIIYPGENIQIPDAGAVLPDRMGTAGPAPTTTSTGAPANVPQPYVASKFAPVATQPSATMSDSVWTELANCESGGNWSIDTGNGFYGGLQFTLSSWQSVGGSGYPNQASESEQIARAQTLQAKQGWGAWPTCSAKLGL